MSVEQEKTAYIATSSREELDTESQKSDTHTGAGAFEIREGHHLYRPIDGYEGLHRWDPNFEWTDEEEKKIVRKAYSNSSFNPVYY